MKTFIQSAVSLSAAGFSGRETLEFDRNRFEFVDNHQPYFAMKGLPLIESEGRLYEALFSVIEDAIVAAGLDGAALSRTAFLLGSTSLDIGCHKPPENRSAIWLPNSGSITEKIVEQFGLGEFYLTINTACTAAVNAILLGQQLLRHESYDHVLIVGCEFYNKLTVEGFQSLNLISQTNRLNVFSEKRDGLILGEGVGALIIGKEAGPSDRTFVLLDGCGGCDTFSLTTTQENGEHIREIIVDSLVRSKVNAEDITLIKVHGTATLNNDLAEENALSSLFTDTPVTALKPFIGHTLGACGALELAIMHDFLVNRKRLPVPYTDEEYGDSLLRAFVERPLNSDETILLNHSGFGGSNAALVAKVCEK